MSSPDPVKSILSANEKRQILADLLRQKAAATSTIAPPTIGQRALFYLDRARSGSRAYNAVFVAKIQSPVDVSVFRQALQNVVDRHSVLRTTYETHEGTVVQRVHGAREVDFQLVAACGVSLEELEARWLEEVSRAYDLNRDSSLRVRLYSRSAAEYVLVIGVHHIAFDFWSSSVLIRDLQAFYEAALTDTRPQMKPLPMQFADYARAQETMLAGPRGEHLWQYWKRELAADLPALQLPLDRPRAADQTTESTTLSFDFAPQLVTALRTFAHERHTTPYVVLLAAWHVLLFRYSGQDDIVIGSPMACRGSTNTEDLIGHFVNMVPLRADLSGDPAFDQLLGQVRQRVMGALEHQDFPFALLVEKLGCKRDSSRSPIFDVAFGWEKSHVRTRPNAQEQSLDVDLLYARQLGAPYDLTLLVFEGEHKLSATLLYNTELFEAATIARMANHFRTLLSGIMARPTQRVSLLPLIVDDERREIVEAWNATAREYPRQTIQQLFERQVDCRPDAVAAQYGAESLTYHELNCKANQLAHHLRRGGVRHGDLVAICVERSLEMLVGILGILKAGAAYLPLDPTYPSERLSFMLQDSGAAVFLAEQSLAGKLTPRGRAVVYLDSDCGEIAQNSLLNPTAEGTSDDLAYVMYTSGSTGIPKGIEIPQCAINRLVLNTDYVALGPDDRVAQAANSSFDAATFEIWGALLNGARIVGISQDVVVSPQQFAAVTREHGITTLFLTTALFNQLAERTIDIFRTVKNVLFGGEAVDPKYVASVLRNGRPKRLLHVYGPTECTTFATWYLIDEVPDNAVTIPIGRPIANTTAYVLDQHRQPVPVGIAGELYIGGDGLARGYLNRPELTEEKFVHNPFSDRPAARLYRSGDLAKYCSDGTIEFLGRIDDQVKIRGFRIEPGEIASTLLSHDSVQDAIVVAREQIPGQKGLVAYVLPKKECILHVSELRAYLEAKLPEFMIPAAFVTMNAFPLSPNGKVDRSALPAPKAVPEEDAQQFVEPESNLEQIIAAIWQRALKVERVGRYDNFFDLGGHSLLVAKVHEEMQQATGRPLAIVEIFRHPTVSSIAGHLQRPDKERSLQDVRERARQQRLIKSRSVAAQQSRRPVHEQS